MVTEYEVCIVNSRTEYVFDIQSVCNVLQYAASADKSAIYSAEADQISLRQRLRAAVSIVVELDVVSAGTTIFSIHSSRAILEVFPRQRNLTISPSSTRVILAFDTTRFPRHLNTLS